MPSTRPPKILFCALLIAGTGLWAKPGHTEGALAIGQTGNIAADGIALGISADYRTRELARQQALQTCRNFQGAPERTRALCKLTEAFRKKCAAVALDPEAGTPGAGWAVAKSKDAAESEAMKRCRDSAGRDRREFCKVAASQCDKS
jgi:hypothetical protein